MTPCRILGTYIVVVIVLAGSRYDLLFAADHVDDPRPLARAIESLEQQYGFCISYEDPPSVPNKPMPVTLDDRNSAKNGKAADALQSLLGADTRIRGFAAFRSHSVGPVLHIIPTRYLGDSGQIEPVTPILDVNISMPSTDWTPGEWIAQFCRAVSIASGQAIQVGTVPMNIMSQRHISVGAANQQARTLLSRALIDLPVSWQVWYAPGIKAYWLNIHIVPSLQVK